MATAAGCRTLGFLGCGFSLGFAFLGTAFRGGPLLGFTKVYRERGWL
jgi:hypothetical protein